MALAAVSAALAVLMVALAVLAALAVASAVLAVTALVEEDKPHRAILLKKRMALFILFDFIFI